MDRWIQQGEVVHDFFIYNATDQAERIRENEVGTLKRLFAEQVLSLDMDCVPDFLLASVPAIFASGISVRMCNELGLHSLTNDTGLNVLFEKNMYSFFGPSPASPTNVERFSGPHLNPTTATQPSLVLDYKYGT